jgi:hypothetical protein
MDHDFCIECGKPFASIWAYSEGEKRKYVHSACYDKYARRLLRPEWFNDGRGQDIESEPGFPGYENMQQ